ncbi:hypothetical protein ACIRD9_41170 [Streptomyces violaceus]|uniref:hypothetical protein n=1 Tax=Streptomyces violaceus TaxID=1936 RepID=UPI00382F347B
MTQTQRGAHRALRVGAAAADSQRVPCRGVGFLRRLVLLAWTRNPLPRYHESVVGW